MGDNVYDECDNILTPYSVSRELTEAKVEVNRVLMEVRIVAEMALGSLKGRFRGLRTLVTVNLNVVSDVVITTCILHEI